MIIYIKSIYVTYIILIYSHEFSAMLVYIDCITLYSIMWTGSEFIERKMKQITIFYTTKNAIVLFNNKLYNEGLYATLYSYSIIQSIT